MAAGGPGGYIGVKSIYIDGRLVVWHDAIGGAVYDLAADTWTDLPPLPAAYEPTPSVESRFHQTQSGDLFTFRVDLTQGVVYRLASNTWDLVDMANPPANTLAAEAWTGEQYVVWGGEHILEPCPPDAIDCDPLTEPAHDGAVFTLE